MSLELIFVVSTLPENPCHDWLLRRHLFPVDEEGRLPLARYRWLPSDAGGCVEVGSESCSINVELLSGEGRNPSER